MRQISSKSTFWNKRVFPLIWFGFIALWACAAWTAMFRGGDFEIAFVIIPLFMTGLGYLFMKHLIFDLMDSVWDDGAEIVLRNEGKEDRVSLRNIMNISASTYSNPQRVTLTLREPCLFGNEISFSPPQHFAFWKTHPLVTELIHRVDEARQKG
jgi:hypothetical protein